MLANWWTRRQTGNHVDKLVNMLTIWGHVDRLANTLTDWWTHVQTGGHIYRLVNIYTVEYDGRLVDTYIVVLTGMNTRR